MKRNPGSDTDANSDPKTFSRGCSEPENGSCPAASYFVWEYSLNELVTRLRIANIPQCLLVRAPEIRQ
jgi:hypothetical protein